MAEQRQVVAQVQACTALEQCRPGGTGWGVLRREPRYLQHHLEAETRKLARYTQFVVFIEQGATKDKACSAVLGQQDITAPAEQTASGDAPDEGLRRRWPLQRRPPSHACA